MTPTTFEMIYFVCDMILILTAEVILVDSEQRDNVGLGDKPKE